MNSNINKLGVAGAAAIVAAAPTVALADSPSGADLLLPKPAEFIPALIAFLVIWVVLAKLAWPSILGMMEKRQQKIQDDLDAAAVVAKAHDAVSSERRKAMIELSGSVVDLSVEIASKIIGNDLSEADQRRLAEKYLAEVGAPHDNKA